LAEDLNFTPYNPAFRMFLSTGQTSTAHGFPATWPPTLAPIDPPIDYVLVREAKLPNLEAFPSVGSDHRALKVEILLPAPTQERVYAARLLQLRLFGNNA